MLPGLFCCGRRNAYGGECEGKASSSEENWSEEEEGDIPMGVPLDGSTPNYIRGDFVKKVYSILSVQLLATVGTAYFVDKLVESNPALAMGVYYFSFAVLIGTMCVMSCCRDMMRRFPYNYCMLAVITFAVSCTVGFVTSQYKTSSVLIAVATTALVFLCLTAYACCTKTDWTGYGPYLAAGLMAMIAFGFVMQLSCMVGMCPGTALHKLYSLAGVLLFTMYIVYDTQTIVGGTHTKHQYTVDDYAFAALNLYLDIINLFLYLLRIFGQRGN